MVERLILKGEGSPKRVINKTSITQFIFMKQATKTDIQRINCKLTRIEAMLDQLLDSRPQPELEVKTMIERGKAQGKSISEIIDEINEARS